MTTWSNTRPRLALRNSATPARPSASPRPDSIAKLGDGRWGGVEAARRTGSPPQTAAQRRLRIHGRERELGYEEPIVGVRLFVEECGARGDAQLDYDTFVDSFNLVDGQRPLRKRRSAVQWAKILDEVLCFVKMVTCGGQ
jgi:hypothetical protein